MDFLKELFAFLAKKKKLWMLPLIILLLLLGILIVLAQGTVIAPFTYTLF